MGRDRRADAHGRNELHLSSLEDLDRLAPLLRTAIAANA
jgi:hypothetical protein